MVAKYGQPQRATISFGNPYIPWHDNIIPGGKLGQQLTIMADGHCRVESFVFNRDQWRPITSAAPDELTIPAPQAAQLLKRLLEVMNYFGQPHPADSAPTPTNGRATTIWNAAGQATSFTGYPVDEEEILSRVTPSSCRWGPPTRRRSWWWLINTTTPKTRSPYPLDQIKSVIRKATKDNEEKMQ